MVCCFTVEQYTIGWSWNVYSPRNSLLMVKILLAESQDTFSVQQVQLIDDADYPLLAEFVSWILDVTQWTTFNHNCLILISSLLYAIDVVNRQIAHIAHIVENPSRTHTHTVSPKLQHKLGIKIWPGILGNHILGPYLHPQTAEINLFSYNTSSRFRCREYRSLCVKTCCLDTMVHKHILRLCA